MEFLWDKHRGKESIQLDFAVRPMEEFSNENDEASQLYENMLLRVSSIQRIFGGKCSVLDSSRDAILTRRPSRSCYVGTCLRIQDWHKVQTYLTFVHTHTVSLNFCTSCFPFVC